MDDARITGFRKGGASVTRRDLLRATAISAGALALAPLLRAVPLHAQTAPAAATARVAFIRTSDRVDGIRRALDLLAPAPPTGKRLLLKGNLNSADPSPGSTHPDTLRTLVGWLWGGGAASITLGDRSGMGDTRRVMQETGVEALGQEMGFGLVAFDELADASDWVAAETVPGAHWAAGFYVPRLLREVDGVVQTCNLKTHRFGGHFTMSLKNSVGLAARRVPGVSHDFMSELHGSPYQREMIAELNTAYAPDLVVLDGVQAFTTGGPDQGTRVDSQVVLAGTDRVAIDAVGVALLRLWGTTPEVSQGPLFEQPQIRRAAELGLGVSSAGQIEFLTDDAAGAAYAADVRSVLEA